MIFGVAQKSELRVSFNSKDTRRSSVTVALMSLLLTFEYFQYNIPYINYCFDL